MTEAIAFKIPERQQDAIKLSNRQNHIHTPKRNLVRNYLVEGLEDEVENVQKEQIGKMKNQEKPSKEPV